MKRAFACGSMQGGPAGFLSHLAEIVAAHPAPCQRLTRSFQSAHGHARQVREASGGGVGGGGVFGDPARPFFITNPRRRRKEASLIKARRLTLGARRAGAFLSTSRFGVHSPGRGAECSRMFHACPCRSRPRRRGGAQMDSCPLTLLRVPGSAPLLLPGGRARSRRGGAAPRVHERAPFFFY